ncbi:3-hydroxyacyl-ACP dehydratase FabZ family protein [Botrimarina hoheduenensis]|uniref:3-hydroxyacyl-[acyl-carrier-protein] dehydratase FabZ n=1 Tax=Botrimarina hoheduenensis TaxID=2528000 RepID=A0A5C5VZ87_9BACT|nr:3-hydroxyacyl-ACP dehydratase FabZ family protein [Botrimarina hoheduenensis]TWT43293.1 3-hydroxyacyl-[acyl-carrier-protein] dehydratase FabZ [Botrimarina hoheduenensis]
MPASDWILDPSTLDLESPLVTIEEIRALIPQRGMIEQLTAIVHYDVEAGTVAGYKDVTDEEFWVPGHMPGMPLMPGVMMCEAAAQICSYFVAKFDLLGCEMLGFGGLDNVRFRGAVVPGDRLVVVAQQLAVRRGAMIRCRFQCFVKDSMVCEGELRGIPIPVEALREARQSS